MNHAIIIRNIKLLGLVLLFGCSSRWNNAQQLIKESNTELVRKMFTDVYEKLSVNKLALYFSPNFELYSDERTWTYSDQRKYIQSLIASKKTMKVYFYDLLSQGDRVAGRISLTIANQMNQKEVTELIFILQINDQKIARFWEFTDRGVKKNKQSISEK